MKKSGLLLLLAFCSIFVSKEIFAATIVKVGGYVFPPYINAHNLNEKQNGITFELIKELNNIQKDFIFEFVPTSSSRRYIDYKKNNFDLIFFEDISWGWKEYDVIASQLIVKDEEIYIAKNKDGRDESYFSDKKNKKFVGIKGYHYAFANFNSDVDYLKKTYGAELTSDHEGSIKMILMDRGDIGIVTHSYLDFYLNSNPDVKDKIILAKNPDQIYNLSIISRKGISPNIEQINKYLSELKKNGVFKKMFKVYNLNKL